MQMIQIKEQEKTLFQYKTDVQAMKEEIESKRSPWFDEVHPPGASVRHVCSDSYERRITIEGFV